MSGQDFYRFEIVNGQVTRVMEFDDGRWEAERIDSNETYTLDGKDVIKTENERYGAEISRYSSTNGTDYFKVSEVYQPYSSNTSTTSSSPASPSSASSPNNFYYEDSNEYANGYNDDSFEYANGRSDDDRYEYSNGNYTDDSSLEYGQGNSDDSYYFTGSNGGTAPTNSSSSTSGSATNSGTAPASVSSNSMASSVREDMGSHFRAYDLDSAESAGGVYRIYQAAFDRTPDMDGLGYWISQADKGMSAQQIAQGFVYSNEFESKYGVDIIDDYASNADVQSIVSQMYRNVLNREADQGGLDFYTNSIETHERTLSRVLAEMSDSSENRILVAGTWDNNYVEFNLYEGS